MAVKSPLQISLPEILGAGVGGGLAYLLTSQMPGFAAAVACAAIIVLLSAASSRLTHPVLWWAGVGALAGSIVGTGTQLALALAEQRIERRAATRHLVIVTLAITGLLAGIFLGKDVEKESVPRPAEFLKRAGALTVVLYAVIVTTAFPPQVLDAVRALSSRLSTMTTIVATALAVPGWIGFRIGTRWGAWLRARLERSGLPVDAEISHPEDLPRQPGQ